VLTFVGARPSSVQRTAVAPALDMTLYMTLDMTIDELVDTTTSTGAEDRPPLPAAGERAVTPAGFPGAFHGRPACLCAAGMLRASVGLP